MSPFAIIDSSVYIEHFRRGAYKENLLKSHYLVRNSSVVLSELYRGCRSQEETKMIDELAENFPVVTPSEKNWFESGVILSEMASKKGYSKEKLRDLHFDVLIALSSRAIGATLITINEKDFREIQALKKFDLLCW